MEFFGENNETLGLEILNLEFPYKVKNDSSDWLIIRFSIRKNEFNFFEINSANLCIYEVESLVDWLKSAKNNTKENKKWDRTMENNLVLELLDCPSDNYVKMKIMLFNEEKYSILCNTNYGKLYEYAIQIEANLKLLYEQFVDRKKMYKLLTLGRNSIKKGIVVNSNKSIFKKNNFIDKFDKKEGYKIIYSKLFISDLDKIKKTAFEKDVQLIEEAMDFICDYPCEDKSIWEEYFVTYGIRFKIANEYIVFYSFSIYESINFLRLIKNTGQLKKYLEYMSKN